MTKQEFLDKWKMPEFMIETNTDFKMMLLSNISSIQEWDVIKQKMICYTLAKGLGIIKY